MELGVRFLGAIIKVQQSVQQYLTNYKYNLTKITQLDGIATNDIINVFGIVVLRTQSQV